MKILFITHITKDTPMIKINDIISDSILLGLKECFSKDIIDYPGAWHMDKSEVNKRNVKYKNFWGNGFTFYDLVNDYKEIDRSDIEKKIKDDYFEFIIYGSVRRSKKFLNEALNSNSKLIFIDGEDNTSLDESLIKKGIYFKRELIYNNHKSVYPINCSVPKEKIIDKVNLKPKNLLAPLIPGRYKTYVYDNEKDYYKMWQNSIFGISYAHGGWWEAMRYYEMLMNGCIPLILELDKCPQNTLTKLPKKQLIEIFEKYSWILNNHFPTKIFKKKFLSSKKFIMYFQSFFTKKYSAENFIDEFPEINELRQELLEYTKKNLTTEIVARELINTSKNFYL
ncbi:hypothetical protein N9T65_00305 [Candidatus Pelagibacter sp.]|nr:hypothetical protein [Candidatus Pelagibacter sp.]MDA9663302.1 hypothetical protein [Candidatus Pelagibacter sp.]